VSDLQRLAANQLDTIKTHVIHASTVMLAHHRFRVNHFLYFFQIFKELLIGKSQYLNRLAWVWVLACVGQFDGGG